MVVVYITLIKTLIWWKDMVFFFLMGQYKVAFTIVMDANYQFTIVNFNIRIVTKVV